MFANGLNVLLLIATIQVALACNGYKATVKKVENCAGDDAVITIDPNFSLKLNKKCELIPSGCVTNKAFSTARVKYMLKKDGNILKDADMDACESAANVSKDAKSFMQVFAVPDKCPVAENKICSGDHKIDISKYKNMLSMARGNIVMDATIEHDTGTSCFHIEMDISK